MGYCAHLLYSCIPPLGAIPRSTAMREKPSARRRKRISREEMLRVLMREADHIFSNSETVVIGQFIQHMTWIDGSEPRSNKSWYKEMTYEDLAHGVRDPFTVYVDGICPEHPEIVLEILQGLKDYGVFTEYRQCPSVYDGTSTQVLHLHPEHLMDLLEGSTGDYLCGYCDNLIEKIQESARV